MEILICLNLQYKYNRLKKAMKELNNKRNLAKFVYKIEKFK